MNDMGNGSKLLGIIGILLLISGFFINSETIIQTVILSGIIMICTASIIDAIRIQTLILKK